ncbi:MAG TPA: DUF2585 family protein [Candidatus Margulisiibacteriota bacterium]|nr:DUF2585 family protein [Candidatus Margulisiibacteriota bacterium]
MALVNPRRHLPFWACIVLSTASPAVAAMILWAMGRAPYYQSGPITLWYGDAWGPQNSQQLTDPYTFTHVTHGILLYWLLHLVARRVPVRARGALAMCIESAWEVFENTAMVINRYRAATMALGYYGDSVLNSMGDILACAVGFLIAACLPTRATVILVLALEVTLALWIRDSLLLNVVMLIYPIAAVKTWQLRAAAITSTVAPGTIRPAGAA